MKTKKGITISWDAKTNKEMERHMPKTDADKSHNSHFQKFLDKDLMDKILTFARPNK